MVAGRDKQTAYDKGISFPSHATMAGCATVPCEFLFLNFYKPVEFDGFNYGKFAIIDSRLKSHLLQMFLHVRGQALDFLRQLRQRRGVAFG